MKILSTPESRAETDVQIKGFFKHFYFLKPVLQFLGVYLVVLYIVSLVNTCKVKECITPGSAFVWMTLLFICGVTWSIIRSVQLLKLKNSTNIVSESIIVVKENNAVQNQPSSRTSKVFGFISLILGALNVLPPITFFLGWFITPFCFITLIVFWIKKDRRNAWLSGIGLIISVVGYLFLFKLMDHGGGG